MIMKKGKLFVISAPSGAGKTTVVHEFLLRFKNKYKLKRVVTYTTRPPRVGEEQGVDYHFVSADIFKEMISNHRFLEWSTWYDYYYGSPSSIIHEIEEGHSFILVVDRHGAQEICRSYSEAVLIWIIS